MYDTLDILHVKTNPSFDVESIAKGYDGIYQDGPNRYGRKISIPYFMLRDPSSNPVELTGHAIRRTKREMAGYIAEEMGETQYNIKFEIHVPPPIDDFDAVFRCTITADVIPTKIEKIVTAPELSYFAWSNGKTRCQWCGGLTHDDRVGNCGACGGPRL